MLVTSFERMSEMLLLVPPVASSRVVRLPNMPPSPSAISLVCSTRLAGGACTNDVRQIFQTLGNPPPTCPLCIVPKHFSCFLLSDLVQTSYVMPA